MSPTPDSTPVEISYPFDHDRLRRYLRIKGAILWIGVLLGLGIFMGFGAAGHILDNPNASLAEKIGTASRRTATGAVCGAILGAFCYFILTHRRAEEEAKAISLRVAGPFVRITLGGFARIDRKLHFRAIIDYSLVEGPLRRRLGLKTLVMNVPSGQAQLGVPSGHVILTGLRDPDRVRDELAALDAAREHLNG